MNTTEAYNRIIKLEGGLNCRDAGGYQTTDGRKVQQGKLYRSGMLSRLSLADRERVAELGIAWVCDLRDPSEALLNPTPAIGAAKYTNLSFLPQVSPDRMKEEQSLTKEILVDANRLMIDRTEEMGFILRELLHGNGEPVLIHCAAGKDRTGFVIAVILRTLGVSEEDVLTDYLLTNSFAADLHRMLLPEGAVTTAEEEETMNALLIASAHYLQAAFDRLEEQYGSFEQYLRTGLGFTDEERLQLQALYVN